MKAQITLAQFFSTTGGSSFSHSSLINQRFLFPISQWFLRGCSAFQPCEHVLKLSASQVSQNRDPTLLSTYSNSPRQCSNMNATSLNRFLKYSCCRLISRRGFTVQSLSRALPFPLLSDIYCRRKQLLHNLPWPFHEGNALQLRMSKSVCVPKGFYNANIELLGKIKPLCA